MRVYIIGNDGITLCREPPAAVNEGEIEARNIPSPPRGGSSERVSTGEEVGFSLGGTDGSNPSPSTSESAANLDFLDQGCARAPRTCMAQRASVVA